MGENICSRPGIKREERNANVVINKAIVVD